MTYFFCNFHSDPYGFRFDNYQGATTNPFAGQIFGSSYQPYNFANAFNGYQYRGWSNQSTTSTWTRFFFTFFQIFFHFQRNVTVDCDSNKLTYIKRRLSLFSMPTTARYHCCWINSKYKKRKFIFYLKNIRMSKVEFTKPILDRFFNTLNNSNNQSV